MCWIVNIESKIRLAAEKKLKLKVEYAKAPSGTAYFLLVVYMRSLYVYMLRIQNNWYGTVDVLNFLMSTSSNYTISIKSHSN